MSINVGKITYNVSIDVRKFKRQIFLAKLRLYLSSVLIGLASWISNMTLTVNYEVEEKTGEK